MAGPARKKRKLSSKSKMEKAAVPSASTSVEPKHTLYINNLPDHIPVTRLRANLYFLFSIYGEVIKVSVNPRKRRGQAFITLKSVDEANLAMISLDKEPFFGKLLNVSFSMKETTNV
ncbi:hypothetical protein HG536_0C04160 [Torulaspora globosa]|uniref:RRM domain-containing protein n=1 Tax=Torulaspora globosa TaxID=48254 RepID=A0A7G3ZFG1_9SACH|nr:uncharacterized protein HG536_0C04160 [Torulaspora globosa]QLL32247.1 hypothetical protein HG536_0C04160 [Torulaspora globosa]